jgi:hypothetical protein
VKEYQSNHRYAHVLGACMNSTVLEETKQSSPIVRELLYPIITDEDKFYIKQHQRAIANYFNELNGLMNAVDTSCNKEEVHALLCLSNPPLLTTCAQKILQRTYDDIGYETYQAFVQKTKEALLGLNEQLSRLPIYMPSTD